MPTIARKTVLGLPLQSRLLLGVGKLYFNKVVGEFGVSSWSSKVTRVPSVG